MSEKYASTGEKYTLVLHGGPADRAVFPSERLYRYIVIPDEEGEGEPHIYILSTLDSEWAIKQYPGTDVRVYTYSGGSVFLSASLDKLLKARDV